MSGGSHALRRERRRTGRNLLVGVTVLALAAAGAAAWVLRPSDAESADACTSHPTATVAAAPSVAPLLTRAAAELRAEGWCGRVEVAATQPSQVLSGLLSADTRPPDLWVPDSDVWQARATAAGVATEELAPSVASSPVVLAGSASTDAPDTWFDALGSGDVLLGNPQEDVASALALLTPGAEVAAGEVDLDEVQAQMTTVAQHYTELSDDVPADPDASFAARLNRAAVGRGLVPVTEQQLVAVAADHPRLTSMVPGTGSLVQQVPVLATRAAAPAARTIADRLVGYLAGPGQKLVADAGFRSADGSALGGVGAGDVPVMEAPDDEQVVEGERLWQVLTVPSSILAVLDASGSMDFETGAGTRMEVAVNAARTALNVFPDQARVGAWLFSIDQGGPGQDYRELEPLRPLDAQVGGTTQRQALDAAISGAVDETEGGTGLYDTTLAAYREAVARFDEGYFNSVVIISDGANDDPGSLELGELLKALEKERDPGRPVRIIAIGISQDADLASLKKIAAATQGAAYAAEDPRDILTVMSEALLGR
ncbi:substrate-binding domain-containing protein [Nocardioides guangzhouensis]|uniref:substrate-binding domain-containing protein n=1 Tax=Nocardioides guangzhouensis TaxID=2497878 RepID=UPI00143844B4|nr:substrate-binding domain-containing protein [Nocardioides guangzhouensis]